MTAHPGKFWSISKQIAKFHMCVHEPYNNKTWNLQNRPRKGTVVYNNVDILSQNVKSSF